MIDHYRSDAIVVSQFRLLFVNPSNKFDCDYEFINDRENIDFKLDERNLNSWLTRIHEKVSVKKDQDERLSAASELHENINEIQSLLNTEERFLFFDLLLQILQDEDSEVRIKSAQCVHRLLSLNYLPSFNVAINLLFNYLVKEQSENDLINYLIEKLNLIDSVECSMNKLKSSKSNIFFLNRREKYIY